MPTLDLGPEVVFVGEIADAVFDGDWDRGFSAGDIDGDGLTDLLLMPGDGPDAYVFHGPVSGVLGPEDAETTLRFVDITGVLHLLHIGGDVNGDGSDDFVFGLSSHEEQYPGSNHGAVFTYNSPHEALVEMRYDGANADARIFGDGWDLRFGDDVATRGDANGDGIDDLLASAPGTCGERGGAFLHYGPLEGEDWEADARLCGPEYFTAMATDVSFAGDMDGDGTDDLLVDACGYYSATFLVTGPVEGEVDLEEEASGVYFEQWPFPPGSCNGLRSNSAGDVNGDGIPDVALLRSYGMYDESLYEPDTWTHGIYLVFGPADGEIPDPLEADVTVLHELNSMLSLRDAIFGDFNGDGFRDLTASVGMTDKERDVDGLLVFFGPLEGDLSFTDAALRITYDYGVPPTENAVWMRAESGDFDGDGCDDLAVHTSLSYSPWDSSAFVLLGCRGPLGEDSGGGGSTGEAAAD